MPKLMTGSVPLADQPAKATETREGGELTRFDVSKAKIRTAKLADLTVNEEWNPRISLPNIEALADSIRTSGIETAIRTVRYKGKTLIVRGHRRFAACKLILESGNLGNFNPAAVPIEDMGEYDHIGPILKMYVDHNTARLRNDMEQARACENLRRSGMVQDEIAKHLGFSRSKVQHLLGLASLPTEWRDRYTAFLKDKDTRKMEDIRKDPSAPVFDQRTVQRLITAWNIKNDKGRPEAVTDELARDFGKLTAAWEADKGRTLAGQNNGKGLRTADDVKELRQKFAGSGDPAVKDAVLGVLDWFIRKDGAEDIVYSYVKL